MTGTIDNLKKEKRQLSTAVGGIARFRSHRLERRERMARIAREKEQEQLRIQRDAKLRKIGNIISDTCVVDKNEVVSPCYSHD